MHSFLSRWLFESVKLVAGSLAVTRLAVARLAVVALFVIAWTCVAAGFASDSNAANAANAADAADDETPAEAAVEASHDEANKPSAHGDDHEQHADGHHDPYDKTHAGASPTLEDPSVFRFDMALYSLVVFLLLLGILWAFAWGPIMKGLDAREAGILSKINEATAAAEKAQATLAEYQAKLDAGAEEVREMLAEARRDAEATKARITAEAEATAAKQRQQAIDDIHRAKEGALRELADMSATQAVELAQGIVGRQITGEDHARLVQEAIDRMPSSN